MHPTIASVSFLRNRMETITEPRTELRAESRTNTTIPAPAEQKSKSGRRWIIGVTAVYTFFAVGTLAIVALTMTYKVDLVSEKYYQQEVAYQSRIDAANRAKALAEPVAWRILPEASGKVLEISYPQSMMKQGLSGTIMLLRPSTMGMDKTIAIAPDANGKQRVPLQGLLPGFWSLSLEWQVGGMSYYKASDVNL
jgi:hypothetical protein